MKKRVYTLITALLLLGGAVFLAEAHRCSFQLRLDACRISTELSEPLRIVQLTDLHGGTFGEDNGELIRMVAQQEPDLIFMTGDMLDRNDPGPETVCRLISALTPIAPVYYGYGNHEKEWERRSGESLAPALEAAGAVVLDCAWVDVTVKGQALRIGGYHGYYRQPGMYDITPEEFEAELRFCEEFEATDRYKLLLCHIPTSWLDWGYLDQYPVDLVFSGHYHGGQVILPLVGPVYAPYVGLFPEYTRGIYYGEQATCILSPGLGSSPGIPRINNTPRIVTAELVPGEP